MNPTSAFDAAVYAPFNLTALAIFIMAVAALALLMFALLSFGLGEMLRPQPQPGAPVDRKQSIGHIIGLFLWAGGLVCVLGPVITLWVEPNEFMTDSDQLTAALFVIVIWVALPGWFYRRTTRGV